MKGRRRQRRVLLPERILRVKLAHHLDRLGASGLVAAQVAPPGLAAYVVNLLVGVGAGEEDGADGDVARLDEQRQRRQAGVVTEGPGRLPQVLVVHNVELAEELKEVAVRVVDHHVKGELLQHHLLVDEDAVTPAPVLLALLIDDELGILLRDLGDGDDNVLCLAAVFFDLVGEE